MTLESVCSGDENLSQAHLMSLWLARGINCWNTYCPGQENVHKCSFSIINSYFKFLNITCVQGCIIPLCSTYIWSLASCRQGILNHVTYLGIMSPFLQPSQAPKLVTSSLLHHGLCFAQKTWVARELDGGCRAPLKFCYMWCFSSEIPQ